MQSKKELLFATHNKNKAKEIKAMLGEGYDLLTLDEAGVTEDIPETSDTIRGNALIKARYLHEKTGKGCFADDTGLEVEALNGAPGVHTARYAGPECDPKKNIAKMLKALDGEANRAALFRTVIAYISADGQEHVVEGICRGSIATSQRGDDGFGYDPIFVPDGCGGKTFAEMPLSEKNKVSHRAKATEAFINLMKGTK